ncbi:L-lactate permease [Collibacillus ludicampi]|uniref:L-lactate permease n=1 Tax=Collibacillus ludicampi TaxID=2771369 RepID=A0AAV4LCA8_9BACL|nr:L-lactate permease [Collibacillus ludicampi]GIM45413.1 L-lactate permease [Collibacillus ludicampi]
MFLQTYVPLSPVVWSVLLAVLPLVLLCLLLATAWMKPPGVYGVTLLLTIALAGGVWNMPMGMITSTVLYGVLFALFPLFYMIWSSLLLFRVAEKCRYIDSIQNTLKSAENGIEWKVLLVGFGLTAFIDSTAGFLAPITIVTALLSQLGVDREKSAVATLTSCAIPAVYGAVGVPILLLSQVTGHPLTEILRQSACYDFVPAMAAPFLTCLATCGWKSAKQFLSPCLIGGFCYAAATLISVLYISPFLGGMIGAGVYIAVIVLLAKNRRIFTEKWLAKQFLKSWWPFVLLTLCVMIWNLPIVQTALLRIGRDWPIPMLDKLVITQAPFGHGALSAVWKGQVAASAGTAMIAASLLTALTSGMGWRAWFQIFISSLYSMRWVAFNLSMICSVGFLLVYSGIAGTLAYPFQHMAAGYLLIAPLMGWLGTFLTGSNAASIALFGGLQTFAAQMVRLPPSGIAACFAVAAVGGKMIAPQALEVAVQSAGLSSGSESKLLKRLAGFSLFVPLLSSVVASVWKLAGMT